jgi:hypothetical protein
MSVPSTNTAKYSCNDSQTLSDSIKEIAEYVGCNESIVMSIITEPFWRTACRYRTGRITTPKSKDTDFLSNMKALWKRYEDSGNYEMSDLVTFIVRNIYSYYTVIEHGMIRRLSTLSMFVDLREAGFCLSKHDKKTIELLQSLDPGKKIADWDLCLEWFRVPAETKSVVSDVCMNLRHIFNFGSTAIENDRETDIKTIEAATAMGMNKYLFQDMIGYFADRINPMYYAFLEDARLAPIKTPLTRTDAKILAQGIVKRDLPMVPFIDLFVDDHPDLLVHLMSQLINDINSPYSNATTEIKRKILFALT